VSGFVGIVNTDRAPLDTELLARMTASMAFRGPDAQHTWTDHHVGLGHALLRTTVDAAEERQPCGLGGDVWIAGHARVDGRASLIQQLREAGREATSSTPDAELILHAYLAWGDACLDHLIGDFAFVLWDHRRRRLLAARDQLGVAQLFHAHVGGALVLGNTLQSLLLHPRVPHTLDELALADVALLPGYLDEAATGYAAIRRLPPGHKLTWDARGVHVARYWTLRDPSRVQRFRRADEYAEAFRGLFDQAVEDRLRTGHVGTQLSGGMDSTSIAVTAHRSLQATGRPFDLRAYSIEYRSLIADDEASLAAEVARHAGFPVEVLSGDTYMGAAPSPDATWVPPEPGMATLWVMAEVCRRAAQFGRVLLTGYGGDPLLHPPSFTVPRAWAALRDGQWTWPIRRAGSDWRRRRRDRQTVPLPAWVDARWAQRLHLADRVALFRRRSRPDQAGMTTATLWRTLFALSDSGYHGLPLDIRFPFFDLRLLEFVVGLPPAQLHDKRVLRDAMANRLPDAVRIRPKTAMRGDVAFERNKQSGPPAWELELLATPEMAHYVDATWLRDVRRQSASEQAHTWATQRPPVQLAYWLAHRPGRDTRRSAEPPRPAG
jgi:asparagine synthase (glutamine-hydrolysing)